MGIEVTKERDTLKERIKVIIAEAKTYLNSAQSRLEQVQNEAARERKRLEVDLQTAQRVTKQITIERDQLLAKIDQLTRDLKLSQTTIVQAKTLQTQQSTEIDRLKVTLTTEKTNVEKEYNAKL